MEMLNKIEVAGIVGRADTQPIGKQSTTRFSLATQYAYKDKAGESVIETTWFSCTASSAVCPNARNVEKGDNVRVAGRLKMRTYSAPDGEERQLPEIVVNEITIVHKRP